NHVPLIPGEFVHEPVDSCQCFDLFEVILRTAAGDLGQNVRITTSIPTQALRTIGNRVGGYTKKPGRRSVGRRVSTCG
ncbi:MAG TPA: hypothetical protein VGJ48_02010, partial [Pyrinomonadaceae bacterium]